MLKIKDWSRYQSYKDRKPPWIRMHKDLLDNYEFQSMSAEARALLPMLWLLASEDEDPVSGLLRDGYEKMSFRLRMDPKLFEKTVNELIVAGFVEDAQLIENKECNETVTEPYSNRTQTVTPETETETETERGASSAASPPKQKNRGSRLPSDWVLPEEWGDWALQQGMNRDQVLAEEEKFRDYWLARAGPQGIKMNWEATWRNWVRRAMEFKK